MSINNKKTVVLSRFLCYLSSPVVSLFMNVFRSQGWDERAQTMLLPSLAVEELAGGLTCGVFEHAGEVLRVFKAQFGGYLVDEPATEDEVLGTHNDETADKRSCRKKTVCFLFF